MRVLLFVLFCFSLTPALFADKRALRLAKRKLGSHTRAKRKREEMSQIAFKLRQEAAKKAAAERAQARADAESEANK